MKRNAFWFIFLLVALTVAPNLAYAYDMSWVPASNDKSLYYIGQIFGNVGNALAGFNAASNPLIGHLFSIFNIAVLTLGSLVVGYTIILSTMQTAQEGEIMGKKFSSLWVPLRSAVGIAFLIPTGTGYSVIQIMMMNIVVYGVTAADQVWNKVVDAMDVNTGPGVTGEIKIDENALKTDAKALLNSMVCMEVLNTAPECASFTRPLLGSSNLASVWAESDNTAVNVGIKGQRAGSIDLGNICGGLKPKSAPSNAESPASWRSSNATGIILAASNLSNAARDIAASNSPSAGNTDIILAAMNNMKTSIVGTPTRQATLNEGAYAQNPIQQLFGTPSLGDQLRSAKNNGWFYAGSYYFIMISYNSNDHSYSAPDVITAENITEALGYQSNSCGKAVQNAQGRTNAYLSVTDPRGEGAGSSESLDIGSPPSNSKFAEFIDAITEPLRTWVYHFLSHDLVANDARGPVASLASVGSDIMSVTQTIWFAVMLAGLIIMLPACTMSGIQPACWMIGVVVTLLVPILTMIIALLWGVGATLGIYVPMIPYIVFTFTALGWLILVIETMVAAPVVALGLVSPSGEHLGKASPAVMLVTGVFLRPSLMVIGLVLAIKLVDAAVRMVNFGFFATLEGSVSGLGIFGLLAVITLYGGLILTIIHECFSLIYILPDKILRWIGGSAEQSSAAKEALKEAKGNIDKGAAIGADAMKTSAAKVGEKAQETVQAGPVGKGLGGGGLEKLLGGKK